MPKTRLTAAFGVAVVLLWAPSGLHASSTLDIVSTQAGVGGITLTFSNPYGQTTTAETDSGVIAGEMKAYYNPDGGNTVTGTTQTLYTFCVDLLHNIGLPSGFYGVNTPTPVSPGLGVNAGQIAWLYDNFGAPGNAPINGSTNYTVNGHTYVGTTFGAALQIALWYLVDPTSQFAFSVSNGTLNTQLHNAYNDFLTVSNGQSDIGLYLVENTGGQSFLYPPAGPLNPNLVTPEPQTLSLAFAAFGCIVGFRRLQRPKSA